MARQRRPGGPHCDVVDGHVEGTLQDPVFVPELSYDPDIPLPVRRPRADKAPGRDPAVVWLYGAVTGALTVIVVLLLWALH